MKNNKVKHELLVPAGNFLSVVAAINNGADAIYIGGKKFGARAFASNFTDEELEKVIKLCHLYGVKVYVTVNTLIYDNEFEQAINYIRNLHEYGVDAVIMQDIGLIHVVHEKFPNLEIHASTQMHNHSKEHLELLEKLGVKRVVFAREMSFEHLNDIETSLEKEVFIHGSLCIAYSGQCLFSSCILNRSGNRGECAGMCRLPYKLYEDERLIKTDGNYLLSPKDLCSVDNFKSLLDSDIVSFKIEGRMKSPAYVGTVTRIYKTLINQYENNEELKVNENDFELLKAIFNRKYTKGYLFNDDNLINVMAPNHQGIHLGNILEITNKKIKIKLDHDINQFEGIRFKGSNKGIMVNFLYDEKDNLLNHASTGSIIYLDNFLNIKDKGEVLLTTPLIKETDEITKKIEVTMKFEAVKNRNSRLIVTCEESEIVLNGPVTQKAINAPIDQERIKKALLKTGNTPFIVKDISFNLDDNIFINVKSLNELRRDALEELKKLRELPRAAFEEKEFIRINNESAQEYPVINVICKTKEQITVCQELGLKNIIVDSPHLMNPNLIYKVPRDNMRHVYSYEEFLATDYASMIKYPGSIGDYHLNVTNHYSYDYLKSYLRSVMLSVEMTESQIADFMQYYPNGNMCEILVYGRIELMLMKHCLLKNLANKDGICHACQNNKKYFLEDRNKEKYPIINNLLTHSCSILNCHITNKVSELNKYKNMGIKIYRVEFNDETYIETKDILTKVIKEAL